MTRPKRVEAYPALLRRLSAQSLTKRFDAYQDVPWDDPKYAIDPHDPRWERDTDDPLGSTDWYQSLPQATRARLGLHLTVTQAKIGVDFEGVLSRGLIEFTSTLPNGSPEFRYAYHEIIEEGQHSLMFQEFINRSGLDPRGLGGLDAWAARRIAALGRTFPELFFLFVLGGEAPIDYEQRRELQRGRNTHPLLRRIVQIHVTEEARHLCFADRLLRERVPKLSAWRTFQLRVRGPLLFKAMTLIMLQPPRRICDEYAIPREVVRQAYTDNPRHQQSVHDGLESVRQLCSDIGLLTPAFKQLWIRLGIWPEQALCLASPGV